MLKNSIDISHIKLETPKPRWGSELANVILDLEKLRTRVLRGTTPPHIFFELKKIFQFLESLGSARIEGNNTTISELVEKVIEKTNPDDDEPLAEILNIDNAIGFLHDVIDSDTKIDKSIIAEIHKKVVHGLVKEGARIAGDYRKENVMIQKRPELQLPDFLKVPDHMDDLCAFINQNAGTENHLLRVAVAHHYFTFVHPFDNGNGRVVRLLTLAMLIKYGFNVKNGNILNPTAIFCNDRNTYYDMLARADEGHMDEWCLYVISGLKKEIQKIDNISQWDYVHDMFTSVVADAFQKKYIDEQTRDALALIVKSRNMTITAGELVRLPNMDTNLKRSRLIKKLKTQKVIKSVGQLNSRIYTISCTDNLLLRSLIEALRTRGFIAPSLNEK